MPPAAGGGGAVGVMWWVRGGLRGEGDLLVLAQDVEFAGGEAELRVGD